MFRTPIGLIGFGLLLSVAYPLAALSAARQPAAVVDGFHDILTDAMTRSAKLGCEGRIKLVAPAVDQTFDLPFLTERTLRRAWKTLSEPQRTTFAAALRTSVITTYATEFSQAGSVQFTIGTTETLASGDAVVHAVLIPRQGSPVTLDYVLKPRGESWQVVNVLAEGVSDLALRATQYDGLIKDQGFEALIARLDAQTQKLKGRCRS